MGAYCHRTAIYTFATSQMIGYKATLPPLAAAITGILVGAAMVSTRSVSDDVPAGTLALLRYAIGLLVLVVPLCFSRLMRFSRKDFLSITFLGILQFAVLMLLMNFALERLSATICALVFSTMPIFTFCFAVVGQLESYSKKRLTGAALAVAGIIWVLNSSSVPDIPARSDSLFGYFALVAATLTGAITTLFYRPYLQRYPALPTCSLAMGASVVFLIIFCLATSQPLIPSLPIFKWGYVVFIGLSSGIGFFCWLWALSAMEASKVATFQVMGPVTAAIIELIMTHKLPSFSLILSLMMVASGLYLVMQSRQKSLLIE